MTTLRGAIEGVFFLPCKVACLRGVVTLFSFKVLQIEFPFFAAFLVSLSTGKGCIFPDLGRSRRSTR